MAGGRHTADRYIAISQQKSSDSMKFIGSLFRQHSKKIWYPTTNLELGDSQMTKMKIA